MSDFVCPRCGAATLSITAALELGADDRSDERAIQHIACTTCAFAGAAWYEESRRGSGEAWHHTAHALPDDAAADLARALAACPAPRDHHCPCPTHRSLRVRAHDEPGFLGPALPMRLAR